MTILKQMQDSAQVVHNVRSRTARSMINNRLAREVSVQPAPPKGWIALCLTTKGRSYGADEPGDEDQ